MTSKSLMRSLYSYSWAHKFKEKQVVMRILNFNMDTQTPTGKVTANTATKSIVAYETKKM